MAAHTIATAMARWTMEGAQARGFDIEAIARRAGLTPALQRGDARVPSDAYIGLLRTLRRVMRDELFGMTHAPIPVGTLAAAARHAIGTDNLREALELGLSLYRRTVSDFSPRLRVRNGVATILLHPRAVQGPMAVGAEALFCYYLVRMAWWIAGRRFPLVHVWLRIAETPWSTETRLLLEATCEYSSVTSGIAFDARWLELPALADAAKLQVFLANPAQVLIARRIDEVGIVDAVRWRLRHDLSGQISSSRELAASLNLSESTFKRRLEHEGVRLQEIKDLLRRDTSIHLLQNSQLPLHEIAARVSFSEPAAFSRAFKKWTGLSPRDYRKRFTGRSE